MIIFVLFLIKITCLFVIKNYCYGHLHGTEQPVNKKKEYTIED